MSDKLSVSHGDINRDTTTGAEEGIRSEKLLLFICGGHFLPIDYEGPVYLIA